MRATIIMVTFIATAVAMFWLLVLFIWSVTDQTFSECRPDAGVVMLLIGWVPPLVVSKDLDEVLEKRARK